MRSRIPMTSSERQVLKKEVRSMMADYHYKHLTELDAVILWVLHEEYGFGEKRLKDFYISFNRAVKGLLKRYEMEEDDDDDQIWLFTHKLKQAGIDLRAWDEEARKMFDGET